MNNKTMTSAEAILRDRKKRGARNALLLCLAILVVAGVVGVFHLPATAKTFQKWVLTCPAEAPAGPGYAGFFLHTHNDDCFDENGNLVCPLPEIKAHVHDESCFVVSRELDCAIPESDGHQHTAECYTRVRGDLTCTLSTEPVLDEEGNVLEEGHVHTDECYAWHEELTCGKEAGEGAHHHDENCYRTVTTLTCDKPEIIPHVHTDACLQKNEDGSVYVDESGSTLLICGIQELTEHVHGPECFTVYELDDGVPEETEETPIVTTESESGIETETETETEIVTITEIESETETVTEVTPAAEGTEEAGDGFIFLYPEEDEDETVTETETETETETLIGTEDTDPENADEAETVVTEATDEENTEQENGEADPADSQETEEKETAEEDKEDEEPADKEITEGEQETEETGESEETPEAVPTRQLGGEKGGATVLAEVPESILGETARLSLDDYSADDARAAILSAVNENAAEGEEREIISLYVIDIGLNVNGEPVISEGETPIRITIRAKEIRGMTAPKVYQLINGTAVCIEEADFDPEAGTVSFTASGFSAFAIADLTGEDPADEAPEETPVSVSMPAQTFEADAAGVVVTVDAPEGAFPAGTTMVVSPVEMDDDTLSNVTGAVESSGEKKVVTAQAVDISFFDAEQNLIEPKLPIKVSMKSAIVSESENVALVHLTETDTAKTVENETPENEASEAPVVPAAPVAEVVTDVQVVENPDEDNEIQFESDAFSVYVLVGTETITTRYLTADGETYLITVTYGPEAMIPEGAGLAVAEIPQDSEEYATYLAQAQNAVNANTPVETDPAETEAVDAESEAEIATEADGTGEAESPENSAGGAAGRVTVTTARFFDITILDAEGNPVEPAAPVDVKIEYMESAETAENYQVVHFGEETEVLNPSVSGADGAASAFDFQASSFSIYGIVGTKTITINFLTASGETYRIEVTPDERENIEGKTELSVEEILAGTESFEEYLHAAAEYMSLSSVEDIGFARFFDIKILLDGEKYEPQYPVQVKITYQDAIDLVEDQQLSVVHFADAGTEVIEEVELSEDGTELTYEQNGFSVIGTVSTVKESGWPTANGQYVLVLQDGDDYYALKQDGTLTKIRFFNNTVSFIGEGTTTTDYIKEYLWYVVSSGNRGKISDEYTEYNTSPDGQTFIDLNNANMFSGTSRQLQIRDGKIYCNGQLPGSSDYTQVTLSASGGQLSREALTDDKASPVFFSSVSSFTANDNETDLFTQIEVESIIAKWKEQKVQKATYDKTAEVYDYENRIYQVDITASSSDYEVDPSIALEFVVDASRSMFFPTSVTEVGTFKGTTTSGVREWINAHGDRNQVYFVIQDKNGKATQFAIFYDSSTRQWRWVDASNYNPPDDVANGGTKNTRYEGSLLSNWNDGSMDDGKIYTTGITGTSNGAYGERKTWISRIEYLKQCVRVAAQVIYAVDDGAQIGLIGFNKNITDYGTFGKDQQQTLLYNLDNIGLDGGTDHQGGLKKAIDKYQDKNFYAQHYAGRKHVVVLVTDGAPNKAGVTWTTIGNTATTLKNLKDEFGHKTELYTMGLSLTNVGSNQDNLFGISSGAGYTYAGEDAPQIINAVTKMIDGIFAQANLVADVKDVIDPAFYPVNKADGSLLAENDWINLSGTKVIAGADEAAGQIKKDSSTGNWYVEWKNQSIDWPTTDGNGFVIEPGWHGTVFVKAKEDFLGGNGISTNAAGSGLEAKKYIVRGKTEPRNLPEGEHTTSFETPYVNVDELDITKNDTEWTVYLGTNVDPLKEVKALWEKVMVKEVVTETDSDHRMSSNGQPTYEYAPNPADDREEKNKREEFPISDLGITLTDNDWADLIAGTSKIFDYNAYGHSKVGTIMVSLTQSVKSGEKDLTESPHDTAITGDAVEKYTLTVSYKPAGANVSAWHTGSYGSDSPGSKAGSITKDNIHIINVYAKGLRITKVNLNDSVLLGAKFALYRTARNGETELLEIDGAQYYKVADLDTSSTGIAVKEQIEQLKTGERYYLVETQTPAGYNGISPIPVNLTIEDEYTPKPGAEKQTTKPESGIFDWTQKALLELNVQSGVKRTDADNTKDLTHNGIVSSSGNEIIYYRIINNPGVELPQTGGEGTLHLRYLGMTVMLGAALLLMARQRQKKES